MEVTGETAADVVAEVEDARRREQLARLDEIVSAHLPSRAVDVWRGPMWGGTDQAIVGHGRIVQPRPKGATAHWFLVGVAAQHRHVSVYVNAVSDGDYLLRAFDGRLGRVKTGPAAITVTDIDRLDVDVFAELLRAADELTPSDAW